jgi:hypothetical protein
MELAEIEKRIAEYEEKAGEIYDSYYLKFNICQLCADEEEHNSSYEEDDEERELSEEEKWCDGSFHAENWTEGLEDAEKLYKLINTRDNIKIIRLVLEGK